MVPSRWVSVVEFHDWALGIGKVFGQESTVVKWNYQVLSPHLVTVCQKVTILDFQSDFSMSKIIRIFLKKKIQKDSDDFWRRKFTLKVQNWHFLTNYDWMETQNLVISFDYSWFLAKNLAYDECWIMKFHYRNSSTIGTIILRK